MSTHTLPSGAFGTLIFRPVASVHDISLQRAGCRSFPPFPPMGIHLQKREQDDFSRSVIWTQRACWQEGGRCPSLASCFSRLYSCTRTIHTGNRSLPPVPSPSHTLPAASRHRTRSGELKAQASEREDVDRHTCEQERGEDEGSADEGERKCERQRKARERGWVRSVQERPGHAR